MGYRGAQVMLFHVLKLFLNSSSLLMGQKDFQHLYRIITSQIVKLNQKSWSVLTEWPQWTKTFTFYYFADIGQCSILQSTQKNSKSRLPSKLMHNLMYSLNKS